jgi:hypothetical protein
MMPNNEPRIPPNPDDEDETFPVGPDIRREWELQNEY